MESFEETGTDSKENRITSYKRRPPICSQEIRRQRLLEEQKLRREQSFETARNLDDVFPEDVEFETADVSDNEMDWSKDEEKTCKLKELFMFSEWMFHVPENYEEQWFFLLCPMGKRCLVRSKKGQTIAYGRRGQILKKFQSQLPNGSRRYNYSSDEVILDCIWDPGTKKFYILDLLYWKGYSHLESSVDFRFFWIKSKITEDIPWVLEKSEENPYPFVPLEYYCCNLSTISSVMSNFPYFPANEPKTDGLLFYHRDASYTSGTTPLVLWLKPFMLPEIFPDLPISEDYYKFRPGNYSTMFDYIQHYEKKSKKYNRGRRRFSKSKKSRDVEMYESEEVDKVEELSEILSDEMEEPLT